MDAANNCDGFPKNTLVIAPKLTRRCGIAVHTRLFIFGNFTANHQSLSYIAYTMSVTTLEFQFFRQWYISCQQDEMIKNAARYNNSDKLIVSFSTKAFKILDHERSSSRLGLIF